MVKYIVFDGEKFSYSDTVSNDQYIKLTDFQYLSKGEPTLFAIPNGEKAERKILDMMNFMTKHNAKTTISIVNGNKFLDPAEAELFAQNLDDYPEEEIAVTIPEMLFGDEVDAVMFSTALAEIMIDNGFESQLN